MAWATWRDSGLLTVAESRPTGTWRVVVNAILANLLNPKLTLSFFAFLPQFVSPHRDALPQMLTLSAVFMAMTFVVSPATGCSRPRCAHTSSPSRRSSDASSAPSR